MSCERSPLVLIGPFPPPVHGMAAVNAAVRAALRDAGAFPRVINVAAPSLDRSPLSRLWRVPKVLHGLAFLVCARHLRGGACYMSVSGGLGQVFELLFIVLARFRGMRVFLHHHSFAYLDRPNLLAALLIRAAGAGAVQVALSPLMAQRLKETYSFGSVLPVSNSVILLRQENSPARSRRRLQTIGFISNISAEKGIFEFLDLLKAVQELSLPLRAMLAGPFQDKETERAVRTRLLALPNVEYVGPKYGAEKDAFFADVDVLAFPTCYVNEAEPLTLHEAMSCGVVVISYARGAIPEIVNGDCGRIIDPAKPFVPEALAQIGAWLDDPGAFEAASNAAVKRFAESYSKSEWRWRALLKDLIGGFDDMQDCAGE